MPSKTYISLLIFFSFFIENYCYAQKNNVKDSLFVEKYLKLSRENEQQDAKLSFLYLDKIETYSRKNNFEKGLFLAKKERAFIYHIQRKYDSALYILNNKQFQSYKAGNIEQGNLYNLKGLLFKQKGKIDSSLFYLNKALKIYRKANDRNGVVSSLNNIGILLYQSGLIGEALQNFEDVYRLALKFKDEKLLPKAINNYATLLIKSGNIEKSKKLFKTLLDNTDLDNPNLKVTIILNWASFLKTTHKVDEALVWYQKALDYSVTKNIPVLSPIHIGLGQVFLSKNKPSKALFSFYKSLNSRPDYSDKKMIYKGLADTYLKLKKQDSIAFYWDKLNTLNEENYKKETKNAITNAQKNVINYKKDIDIQLLTKDNKILVQENRANKFIILSLLSIGLLVLSIVYWLKKQRKLKSVQLANEMKIKEQSLVTYALKVIQKNQLLYDLKEKANQVKLENNDKLSTLQKEISSAITNSVHNDKDWEQFEMYFNDIYQGFYERLKNFFPELTDNDLRVCSLVKLRFTIKEISNLLFLSLETIKSTRYRIRKKMNLLPNQNLSDFLNKV